MFFTISIILFVILLFLSIIGDREMWDATDLLIFLTAISFVFIVGTSIGEDTSYKFVQTDAEIIKTERYVIIDTEHKLHKFSAHEYHTKIDSNTKVYNVVTTNIWGYEDIEDVKIEGIEYKYW